MTTITCDLCGETIPGRAGRVDVFDGVHPHGGTELLRTIDACADCLVKLPGLVCERQLSELKQEVGA